MKRRPQHARSRIGFDLKDVQQPQLQFSIPRALKHGIADEESYSIEKYYDFLREDFPNAHNVYTTCAKLLYSVSPSEKRGEFLMLNLKESDRVSDRILVGPHPHITLAVWTKAMSNVDWRTGYVLLTRDELAKKARVSPGNVSRAMVLLEKYGAMIRHRDGGRMVYQCNPLVGWCSGDRNDKRRGMSPVQSVMLSMHRLMKEAHESELAKAEELPLEK